MNAEAANDVDPKY